MHRNIFQKLNELSKIEKAFDEHQRRCMVPGCNQPAIESHSQQRRGAIAAIAEFGHVVAVKRNVIAPLFNAIPDEPPRGKIEKVGVRKASAFGGFCIAHDTELFKAIDTQQLQINNETQVLALHRRAVAYEIRNKQKMCSMLESAIKISGQYDAIRHAYLEDQKMLLAADIKYSWLPLWESHPVENLAYKWITIDKNIGISMTSCIPPLSDISFDAYMQSCWDNVSGAYSRGRPFFSLSIIPSENQTDVVMIWNKCDSTNVDAFSSRLGDGSKVGRFLDECIFERSEDFCLKPSLWDSLGREVQEKVKDSVAIIKNESSSGHLAICDRVMDIGDDTV